jgi:hypothetical protein
MPSPATTPGGELPFASARYSLEIVGDSLKCGDVKSPQAGTYIWITFDLSPDASGWSGTTADHSLTIRFQRGSPSIRPFAIGLSGTARGSAEDEGLPFPLPGGTPAPSGIRITLSDPVPLSGEMPSPQISDFSNGQFDGVVVFSRNGVTATCPAGAVGWTMNRLR